MPSAIKHDAELSSKGLVTILVESQGSDQTQMEAFLWKRFPQNRCFSSVNTNVPIPRSGGLPHAAVIGVDGTILWSGNPLGQPKQIEELITAELAKVSKGFGDTPTQKKVRATLFGKDNLSNKTFVGIGLQLFDAGMSYADVVGMVVQTELFAQLAGGRSNSAFVGHVYRNVVGTAPTPAEAAYYEGLLARGEFSQASLALLACDTEVNALHIDLTGLAANGLLYLPVQG